MCFLVTPATVTVCSAFRFHLSFLSSSRWTPKSSPSISGVVILTAKCRRRCRNKLTQFHRVRAQPSEKPTCPLRQMETDSEKKKKGEEMQQDRDRGGEETRVVAQRQRENKTGMEIFGFRDRDRGQWGRNGIGYRERWREKLQSLETEEYKYQEEGKEIEQKKRDCDWVNTERAEPEGERNGGWRGRRKMQLVTTTQPCILLFDVRLECTVCCLLEKKKIKTQTDREI